MEQLLTLKQTAEFLNVSEMTVRRWTNNGLLKCYRVGARRARRFKEQDVLAFLRENSVPADSGSVSLGLDGRRVPDGAHVTHLCTDPVESLRVAGAYVAEGLAQKETVVAVCPETETERISTALEHLNVDAAEFIKAGRLHFSTGMATPMAQAEYVSQMARSSKGRFRIFGDMTWTKEKGWLPKDLLKLEEIVNLTPTQGMLFLCQYKLDRFSGEETMMAMETHSHTLYRDAITENPFRH